MDGSWRMRSLNLPRRRSTEETSTTHRVFDFGFNSSDSETSLLPEDFDDVFGGPPQTLLSRKTSATISEFNLYQDLFRSPESVVPIRKGRNVPVFRIPAMQGGVGEERRKGVYQSEGFYDDIFGSDEDRRSRSKVSSNSKSKSKSNCSSVFSSENLSPLRPSIAEDVFFSSFSSNLRPIHIPLQRNLSTTVKEEDQNIRGKGDTPPWLQSPLAQSHIMENTTTAKSSPFIFYRSGSSPEATTIEPKSCHSINASIEDIPFSVVSSLCNREPESKTRFQDEAFQKEEEEEEEIMSSYVIEISQEKREEAKDESVVAIDEAIAWVKEKSLETTGTRRQNVSPSATKPFKELETRKLFKERQERVVAHEHYNQQRDGRGRAQFLMVNEKLRNWITEDEHQSEKDNADCF